MTDEMNEFARAFKLFAEEQERRQKQSAFDIEAVISVMEHDDPEYHKPVDWDNLFTDVITLNNEVKPTRKK